VLGLLTLLLQGLALCVIAGVGYTVYALTHPPRRTYAHAVARGRPGHPDELPRLPSGQPRPFEQWSFKSRGLELPVWDITGDLNANDAPLDASLEDRPILVMTHGWGDSRVGALTRAVPLLPICSRIIMWDLPGHGEAKGRCSMGTREPDDLLALLQQLALTNHRVVLFGWSLGAGVSIVAATRFVGTVAGVIAEAPYRVSQTPARNVLKIRELPYRWNVPPAFWLIGMDVGVGPRWSGFDRADHAGRLKCPLLVIHGRDDRVCPIEDGRAIARAGPGTLVEIADAGHHGLWTEPASSAVCTSAVRDFLKSLRGVA